MRKGTGAGNSAGRAGGRDSPVWQTGYVGSAEIQNLWALSQGWRPDDAGKSCGPQEGLYHDAGKVRGEVPVLLQKAKPRKDY